MKKHTGKMHRGHGGIQSHTGKDKMVDGDHHKANKAHGMGHGFAPPPKESGHEGQGVDVPGYSNNEECD